MAVSRWISGDRSPNDAMRILIEAKFSIPIDSWEQPTGSAYVAPKVAKQPPDIVIPTATHESESLFVNDNDPIMAEVRTCRLLAQALLRDIQSADVTPMERSKVLASALAALERASKLTGENHLSGAKLLKMPFWKRVEKALADGLKGHPEAAAAVERELRKLDEEFCGD